MPTGWSGVVENNRNDLSTESAPHAPQVSYIPKPVEPLVVMLRSRRAAHAADPVRDKCPVAVAFRLALGPRSFPVEKSSHRVVGKPHVRRGNINGRLGGS